MYGLRFIERLHATDPRTEMRALQEKGVALGEPETRVGKPECRIRYSPKLSTRSRSRGLRPARVSPGVKRANMGLSAD